MATADLPRVHMMGVVPELQGKETDLSCLVLRAAAGASCFI